MTEEGALVLFSGGQDSATCLAWALRRFARVETVGFAYGQRHRVELDYAEAFRARLPAVLPALADRLGEAHTVPLDALGALSDTALTREAEIAMGADGLPNTFVSGRGLLVPAFAAAPAHRRGLRRIVAGVCETDRSGYPDRRDDTGEAMQVALNPGMGRRFVVHTPLMRRGKAETWRLAEGIGGAPLVEAIAEETHSCRLGDRARRHDRGFGRSACPASGLRRRGWEARCGAGGGRA